MTISERVASGLAEHLSRPELSRSTRAAATLGGVLVIALIGVVDTSTGPGLSFGILYLLPVIAVAVLFSTSDGYVLAALASATWVFAGAQTADTTGRTAIAWNFTGRFLTMSVVVFLLGVLRMMVIRLSASEARSREFLSTAAHQLRTPIAGLVASAEALAYERDEPTRLRLIDNIVAGTDRSRRLLSSLLELSRLDEPSAIEHRPFDIAALCRREVDSASFLRPEVAVTYRGPTSEIVDSDANGIGEALSNLLDNAVRHCLERVTVRLVATSDRVVVRVTDDGPGVPAGKEATIFEPFVSIDGLGGSGLGLPIARASLRAVGGDLRLGADGFRMSIPRQ